MSDRDLIERLREACSIDGKPSGRHMVSGLRLLAKGLRATFDKEGEDAADTDETLAACIEAEARLFDDLKAAALPLADRLQALSAEVEMYRAALAEISDLPGEINPSNYDHDDACYLNTQFVDALNIATQALKGANNG